MPDETPTARLIRLRAELQPKLLKNLDAAQACADAMKDETTSYLIGLAKMEAVKVHRTFGEPSGEPKADLPANVVPIWPPQKK
jgi:hypothetical protein